MKYIKAITSLDNIPDAIVDDEVYDKLVRFRWNVTNKKGTKNYYYHTRINGKWVLMHRLIAKPIKNLQVDHINRIPYDNRLSNLRTCTNSQNSMNRKTFGVSGFKGVFKKGDKYVAQVKHNGKYVFQKTFRTKEEAKMAYNNKALEVFGEFALCN